MHKEYLGAGMESLEEQCELWSLNKVLGLLGLGRSCWYEGVSHGVFPQPVRLAGRSLWKALDIKKLVDTSHAKSAENLEKRRRGRPRKLSSVEDGGFAYFQTGVAIGVVGISIAALMLLFRSV
jgi:predicted DNA-binding transcriptional regulator AlpA